MRQLAKDCYGCDKIAIFRYSGKLCLFIILGISSLCFSAKENATLFYDNFESVSAVITPDSATDADPVAQSGTWALISEQNTIDIQVCNNASPGPAEGQQYASFRRTGTTPTVLRGNLNFSTSTTIAAVEFDMYVSTTGVTNLNSNGLNFWVRNSGSSSGWDRDLFYDYFLTNGNIRHTSTIIGTFSVNQWVHVKYEFDLASRKYDLTVGAAKYSGLTFNNSSEPEFRQIVFYGLATQSFIFIDNVKASASLCIQKPAGDFNDDCMVDFADLVMLAQNWCVCNLEPASLCGQN
jgi:hypothetical protein